MVIHATSPQTIGRDRELERMRAAQAVAADGRLSVVVLAGEAGIGKTRLAGDFAREVERSGSVALIGSCVRVDGENLPFLPWVQILRALPGRFDAGTAARILGPARAEVARLVPELGEVRAPDAAAAAMVGRLRLFELIGGVIERLAETKPTVLVIEDVQWADPASLDLLSFVTRTVRSGRLMLVVTDRTDEPGPQEVTDRILADIARGGNVDWIDLEPLDVEAVRAQAAAILGHRPSIEDAQRITSRAGGNPFLVEEILASGSVEAAGSRGLLGLLRRRVHGVTSAEREILSIVAIAGGFVDDATVHRVSRMTEADTEAALHAALDAALLLRSGDGYVFRHGLMAEAVEADLLPAEQKRLHALLAEALSLRGSRDAGELARIAGHWLGAGRLDQALDASWVAGGAAERALAFEAASLQYERALALHGRLSDEGSTPDLPVVQILERAAEMSALAGRPARAIELARIGIALEPGSPPSLRSTFANLHRRLRWSLSDMGEYAAAIADAQASLVLHDDATPPAGWTNAAAHHAGLLHSLGRFSEAIVVADLAVEAAVSAGERADEAVALGVSGWSRIWLGHPDEGLERIDRAVAIARELAIPHGLGLALRHSAAAARFVGRYEVAFDLADEGLEEAARVGLQRTVAPSLAVELALAAHELGRWHRAAIVVADALDRDPSGANAVDLDLLSRLISAEAGDSAATQVEEGRIVDANRDIDRVGLDRRLRAELALRQARPEIAADVAMAPPAVARPIPPLTHAALLVCGISGLVARAIEARARRSAGQLDSAASAAEDLRRHLRDIDRPKGGGAAAAGMVAELDAWSAEADAELKRLTAPEPDAWATASAAWVRLGRPARALLASMAELELRSSAHDRTGAESLLAASLGLAETLQSKAATADLLALARRARLRTPTPEVSAPTASSAEQPFGLTAREREVLTLIVGGFSNSEIGSRLSMSDSTASVHVSHILSKLGVTTRVEAAAIAIRSGLDS